METTVQFHEITEWIEKLHLQTGGTRKKIVVEDAAGDLYYFKTSLERRDNTYKHEFWSEIVASRVGASLGFNTLHYDIALHKGVIGCLSKSMINAEVNELLEIAEYLRARDETYKPEFKESYSQYTFDFIDDTLKWYGCDEFMRCVIETIIFDSLIGNGDRHQENWGFISSRPKDEQKLTKQQTVQSTANSPKLEFAPIYDSGSCLGRELLDEKVERMINDKQLLNTYIAHDRCEVRWDGSKTSHFDIIQKIMGKNQEYKQIVMGKVGQLRSMFNVEDIQEIIYGIDDNLLTELGCHKLPDNRKTLMGQMISLRFDLLKELVK